MDQRLDKAGQKAILDIIDVERDVLGLKGRHGAGASAAAPADLETDQSQPVEHLPEVPSDSGVNAAVSGIIGVAFAGPALANEQQSGLGPQKCRLAVRNGLGAPTGRVLTTEGVPAGRTAGFARHVFRVGMKVTMLAHMESCHSDM
jgi:hypothetical protein